MVLHKFCLVLADFHWFHAQAFVFWESGRISRQPLQKEYLKYLLAHEEFFFSPVTLKEVLSHFPEFWKDPFREFIGVAVYRGILVGNLFSVIFNTPSCFFLVHQRRIPLNRGLNRGPTSAIDAVEYWRVTRLPLIKFLILPRS